MRNFAMNLPTVPPQDRISNCDHTPGLNATSSAKAAALEKASSYAVLNVAGVARRRGSGLNCGKSRDQACQLGYRLPTPHHCGSGYTKFPAHHITAK